SRSYTDVQSRGDLSRRASGNDLPRLEPCPTAREPVERRDTQHDQSDHPDREADQDDRQEEPGDEDETRPELREPERANLPGEMRLEPGAASVAALQVVEDDGDDRRPAEEEGSDDRRRA